MMMMITMTKDKDGNAKVAAPILEETAPRRRPAISAVDAVASSEQISPPFFARPLRRTQSCSSLPDDYSWSCYEAAGDDDSILFSSHSSSETKANLHSSDSVLVYNESNREDNQKQQEGQRRKGRVRFSVVQIQEYQLTLGDHPCTDLFPLSLDWEHTHVQEISLTDYEGSSSSSTSSSSSSTTGRSRSLPAVHKLSTWDRCVRISCVRGIQPCEVEKQEQQRHRQLGNEFSFGEDGYELVLPNDDGNGEDEEEADDENDDDSDSDVEYDYYVMEDDDESDNDEAECKSEREMIIRKLRNSCWQQPPKQQVAGFTETTCCQSSDFLFDENDWEFFSPCHYCRHDHHQNRLPTRYHHHYQPPLSSSEKVCDFWE